MSTVTLRANKKIDGTIVTDSTRYFYIESNSDTGSHSNDNASYVGNYNAKEYRSRLLFYPDKNKFINQLITKAVVTIYTRAKNSGYTAPTCVKINKPGGSQANNNNAYNSALLSSDSVNAPDNGKSIDIEITNKEALSYINQYCSEGTSFSIYLGRNNTGYQAGVNYCIYVGIQDDSHNPGEHPRLTLTYIPNSSTGTITTIKPEFGGQVSLTINRASKDYMHKVDLYINDSLYATQSGLTDSGVFELDITKTSDYIDSISTYANAYFKITTYLNGNQLGKTTQTNTFKIYASSNKSKIFSWAKLPIISGQIEIPNSSYSGFFTNQNNIEVSAEAQSNDGSEISYYTIKLDGNGLSYSKSISSQKITNQIIGKIANANSAILEVKITATDKRGRTSNEESALLNCYAYNPPSISQVPFRANSSGEDDLIGTYIALNSAPITYTQFKDNNGNIIYPTATIIEYTGLSIKTNSSSEGSYTMLLSGANTENSYTIKIRISDNTIGIISDFTFAIPSAGYIIHIQKGGKSLGIGKAASKTEKTISLGWKLLVDSDIEFSNYTNGALPISLGGTGSTNAKGAREQLEITAANIGALSSAGGKLTGSLTINGGLTTNSTSSAISLTGNNFTYNGNDVLVLNKNVFYSSEEPSNPSIGMIWFKI